MGTDRGLRASGSIRFRITALATILFTVVLIAAGAALAAVQRRTLTENLRDAIEQRGDDLTDLLSKGAAVSLVSDGAANNAAASPRISKLCFFPRLPA